MLKQHGEWRVVETPGEARGTVAVTATDSAIFSVFDNKTRSEIDRMTEGVLLP